MVLRVVNRLWAQGGYKFRDEFLKLLRDDYRAPLGTVDFVKNAEGARVTINKWVAEATEHKIKELIPHGILTAATRLVLTNAVYFKAHWDEEFSASRDEGAAVLRRRRQAGEGAADGARVPFSDRAHRRRA